jgi:hypothetical protein
MYGRDYTERLQNAGFTVKVDTYASDLEANLIEKYGLPYEGIYFCTKPFATKAREATPSTLAQPIPYSVMAN